MEVRRFVFDSPSSLLPTTLGIITMSGERVENGIGDLDNVVTAGAEGAPSPIDLSVDVVRPNDLLALHIDGINLTLDNTDPGHPVLTPGVADQPAMLIVRFAPQAITEDAYYSVGGTPPKFDPPSVPAPLPPASDPPAPGQVPARIGGTSRLVFRVPAGTPIPFTTEGLLDWSRLQLVVAPAADVAAGAEPPADALAIRQPTPSETALQIPYRLHVSPTHAVTWAHATAPVDHNGRVELWHTRLCVPDASGTMRELDAWNTAPLRALWSPDYLPAGMQSPVDAGPPPSTLTAMTPADRHQIVVLTSAFHGYVADAYQRYTPLPFQASQFMLTALGGWLRSSGTWEPPYLIKNRFELRPPLSVVTSIASRGLFKSVKTQPPRARPAVRPAAPPVAELAVPVETGVALHRFNPARIGDLQFRVPLYDLDQKLDLSQWTHVATQGRDHYVRIVYEGRLKEFGHRASLIKVTERRFEPADGNQPPVAYLRQHIYIVVRQPEVDYTQTGLQDEGRRMPLKRVLLTTLVTPDIDNPYAADNPARITDRSFWVTVNSKDFLFHGVAEDAAGNRIDFAKALIFVPNSETRLSDIDVAFNHATDPARIAAQVPAQKVAYAEGDGSDNTVLTTDALYFRNETADGEGFFRPWLRKADVRLPAVEQLTGTTSVTTIAFDKNYVGSGFTADNINGVFARIVPADWADDDPPPASLPVGFNAQQAGGFATPNLALTCLSRKLGPLGGTVADAMSDTFDPATVFRKGMATLFGVFDLADLLPKGTSSGNAPKMRTRRDGPTLITELDWTSAVKSPNTPADAIVCLTAIPDSRLQVHGQFRKDLAAAGSPTFDIDGSLDNVSVQFFKALTVNVRTFRFNAGTGRKVDVNVALKDDAPIEFDGDLKFVEGLRQLIPAGAFGDGVSIDLSQNPLGVRAGLALALPPVSVGVFTLQNIAFSASLTVPFLDGKPVIDFGFARRDNPFLLAIAIFGGGGFFHIEVDTDGVRMLEASFEFGAVAALNIGVASGEVHIMAGIYFKMEKKPRPAPGTGEAMVSLLTGYLRCGGTLCVLGIVSISAEFYLCFTYHSDTHEACGRATLIVCVEIACFSKSVELSVERCFGSKGGDPTFAQLMDTPQAWERYANAFA